MHGWHGAYRIVSCFYKSYFASCWIANFFKKIGLIISYVICIILVIFFKILSYIIVFRCTKHLVWDDDPEIKDNLCKGDSLIAP